MSFEFWAVICCKNDYISQFSSTFFLSFWYMYSPLPLIHNTWGLVLQFHFLEHFEWKKDQKLCKVTHWYGQLQESTATYIGWGKSGTTFIYSKSQFVESAPINFLPSKIKTLVLFQIKSSVSPYIAWFDSHRFAWFAKKSWPFLSPVSL